MRRQRATGPPRSRSLVDGSYQDHAWPVFADTCRLYAELYPDDVRCIDDDWNTIVP